LVLGVAFALLSRTSSKLSSSRASVVTARLLADSTLQKILSGLQSYNDGISDGRIYPGTSSFFSVSGSTDTGWENRNVIFSFEKRNGVWYGTYTDDDWYMKGADRDWIHNLQTALPVGDEANPRNYLGWYGDESDEFSNALPATWRYVTIGDGSDKIIIGRTAYVIIDESGKLDPNEIAVSGQDESSLKSRPGAEVSEINLTGAGVSPASARALGYDNAGGERPSDAKWFSWPHIIKSCTAMSQSEIDAYTGSIFPYSYDIEACWIDIDKNGQYDSGEDFHRFNLARTDWDSLTVDDILAEPTLFSTDDTTHDGDGIKWLNDFTESGDFPTVSARRRQIAANLLDYCDSDSTPRTDYNPLAASIPPSYVGLENTAYINEIHVAMNNTPVIKVAADGMASYSWVPVVISITPEVVNVYQTAAGACRMELQYTINAVVNKGHLVNFDFTEISGTLTYDLAGTAGHSYQVGIPQLVGFPAGDYETADEGLPVNLTITDIKLHAFLKDAAGNLIDYSHVASEALELDLNIHPSGKFANYQANDPRHNHHLVSWSVLSGDADSGTLVASNSACLPGASGDEDGGTEPWVSTSFIANRPMKSPWELGAIHRGGAWETLNLKAFDDADGVMGGGAYSDGDANILDQVKMSPDTVCHGKVNINTPAKEVLEALAMNIYVGESYDDPGGSTGLIITDSIADNIADAILAINGTDGGQAFTSRAQLASVSKLWDNTLTLGQSDDATKEEIIGKMINLTTVRQNLLTVIILAQSIKDVGGVGTDIAINKDLDADGDVDGSVSETWDIDGLDSDYDGDPTNDPEVFDRNLDGGKNPETIPARLDRYDQYADEITAEQKILAVIYRDAFTNEIKILHYEFLDH
ncbi:MAG: hypothetical protein JW808_05155, partial [Victivallales bacterium]|nr:hypothetical protein [Victivallales bacterium]